MDYKKYLTIPNLIIAICLIFSIYLIIKIGCNLNEIYYSNITIPIESKLDITAIYSSLIIALISIVSLTFSINYTRESIKQTNENIEENRKYYQKTIKQTKELIKQNENNLFIQLRYEKTHRGINDLLNYIDLTLGIYNQLQNLSKTNNPEKEKYLSPRAFLVMQFINIISDYELLLKLPITLKTKLETDLINKYDENASKKINNDEKFAELLRGYEFKKDYELQYNLIKSDFVPKKIIPNFIKYNQFIKEFNEFEDSEMNENMFIWYYGFKKIKTEDFYNHFNNIRQELITNSTEDLILKDKFK